MGGWYGNTDQQESASEPAQAVENYRHYKRVPHDFFQVTTTYENGRGSHGERIGDTICREPWAFLLTTKNPRLPEEAVGVATKTRIFMKGFLPVVLSIGGPLGLRTALLQPGNGFCHWGLVAEFLQLSGIPAR